MHELASKITKYPSTCTSHCVFTPCLMNVNNAFDTNLMLLALDFFLQTGGVKAKLQVVFLRRKKECVYLGLAAKWQGPEQTSSLLTADWQVEVRKQTAGLPFWGHWEGPGTKRQQLVSELGRNEPPRTEGEILVFSVMEPNSSAIGNSYKRRAMEK